MVLFENKKTQQYTRKEFMFVIDDDTIIIPLIRRIMPTIVVDDYFITHAITPKFSIAELRMRYSERLISEGISDDDVKN